MKDTKATIRVTKLRLEAAVKLAEEVLAGDENDLRIPYAFVRAFSDVRFTDMSEKDMLQAVYHVFPTIKDRAEAKKLLGTWEFKSKRVWKGERKLEQLLNWL